MRGKGVAVLAYNISWSTVVIAHSVFDLFSQSDPSYSVANACLRGSIRTYMHVHHLSISFVSINLGYGISPGCADAVYVLLTIAVTTTSVSRAANCIGFSYACPLPCLETVYTFLMHRSLLADSWPGCARSSNLRALETVAAAIMSAQLSRLEKSFMLV